MKFSKWLENWDMTGLKIKPPFLEMEWKPQIKDSEAAWDLYVELLTRITTQDLLDEHGDEKSALKSVYSIFDITRNIMKHYGRDCINFSKIAIIVLNQVIRPFTAKWHKVSIEDGFKDLNKCTEFREELKDLQLKLLNYTRMLGDLAGVEEINDLVFL